MKRYLVLIFLLSTFPLSSLLAQNNYEMVVERNDGTKTVFDINEVKQVYFEKKDEINNSEDGKGGFKSFSLTDGSRIFDSFEITDSTILITVTNQMDCHALKAFFEHDGKDVYVKGKKQISGESINDFSDFCNPVVYTIEMSNGKRKKYTVHLFDLPVVIVNTEDNMPIVDKETWVPSTIRIIDNDGSVLLDDSLKIKGRGNASWEMDRYLKKSYTVKLNKKNQILGMPKSKRWVLLGHSGDWTKLRTPFCFKLSEMAGFEWTPRGKNVEFILNGKHMCNYYLCEQIRVEKDRINIEEMNPADTIGDAITGGVLFEVSQEFDEEYKFKSAFWELPFMFKCPNDDIKPIHLDYFKSYVDSLEVSLVNDEKRNSNEFLKYMDIDSYIRWWIVNEVIVNLEEESPTKNFYMYKERGYDKKLYAGAPWDFDWGTFWKSRADGWICMQKKFYSRLFWNTYFKQRVKEIWNAVKQEYDKYAEQDINNLMKLNKNSVLRDQLLYPVNNENEENGMEYEDAVNYIFGVFKYRMDWMDENIKKM